MMVDFLTNEKVRRGFVALNTKTRDLTMTVAVSDDVDPTVLLDCEVIKFPSDCDPDSNQEPLDQDFKIEDFLKVSMVDADIMQTN